MNQKKRRGFTLIELLAVIVILAIIALIAVPIIMNIISKANKSAFKDTAYGVIQAGELYFAEQLLEPNVMTSDVTFNLPDERLQIKGEVPEGTILITKEGKVAIAVQNGRYCVTKGVDDNDVTITEDIDNCTLPGSDTVSLPDKKSSLNDYTWKEIQAIAESGSNLNDYNITIGDTKTENENIYYLVSDARNEAYGGLVFMYNSYEYVTNNFSGSYIDSPLKESVDDMYNDLPTGLQEVIKTVSIPCKDSRTSEVKLFLPSYKEMGDVTGVEDLVMGTLYNYTILEEEGDVFDYFSHPVSRRINYGIITKKQDATTHHWLWLRTPGYYLAGVNGNCTNLNVTRTAAIAPAFVIGGSPTNTTKGAKMCTKTEGCEAVNYHLIGCPEYEPQYGYITLGVSGKEVKLSWDDLMAIENMEKYYYGDVTYEYISSMAFNQHAAYEVVVPDSVEFIGEAAFQDSEFLTNVKLPTNLKSIESQTFYRCKNLKNINIPNQVSYIDLNAFYECVSLERIEIPSSVKTIGAQVFYNCYKLSEIIFEGTVEQWNAISKGSNWNKSISATQVFCKASNEYVAI